MPKAELDQYFLEGTANAIADDFATDYSPRAMEALLTRYSFSNNTFGRQTHLLEILRSSSAFRQRLRELERLCAQSAARGKEFTIAFQAGIVLGIIMAEERESTHGIDNDYDRNGNLTNDAVERILQGVPRQ